MFHGAGTYQTAPGMATASPTYDPTFRKMGNGQAVAAGQMQAQVLRQSQGVGNGPQVRSTSEQLEVLCGPLLNYRRMSGEHTNNPVWHGSVLLVTAPGQIPERLSLRCIGSAGGSSTANGYAASLDRSFPGTKLLRDVPDRYLQDTPRELQQADLIGCIPNGAKGCTRTTPPVCPRQRPDDFTHWL